MKHLIPVSLLAAALPACGASDNASEDTHHDAGDHHAGDMHAGTADITPLPDDGVVPVVEVRSAWMRPHPQGRDVTAAYFTATLSEGHADRLLSARIDGAERVEMHGHTMDEQGMMRMRPVPPQDLVDTGSLRFAPGGLHLMVHGLAPVVEGDQARGVLVFERSGEVPVVFEVRNAAPETHAGE
ncbi:copper chaperone PCu(A)C [Maricaulis maris]|nr:copper chaperone PCu(A)C [Maricaulis maris]